MRFASLKFSVAIALLVSGAIANAGGGSDATGDEWSFITEQTDDPLLPGINPLQAGGTILTADNTQMSEDDNILDQGVLGSPYSVSFFGYAYYQENAAQLSVLTIDGVEASGATADNASYPLARPKFIYTTADIMRRRPQVAAFVNFYLTLCE